MSAKRNQRVILVTGANRGIGRELVRKLAKNPSYRNYVILLGSRDIERGEDALKQLGSPSNVKVFQLDTSSTRNILYAVDDIKQRYGGVDILINNAGVWTRELTVKDAREVLQTNYYGVKMLNEQLFPLLRENARVVNVSSSAGPWTLHNYTTELREEYLSPTLTPEQLDGLVEDFIAAVETNHLKALGYESKSPSTIYNYSKLVVNVLTRIQAKLWSSQKNVTTYTVCPGFCATDMTRHAPGARSPELGADSILFAVLTPQDKLENGAFYRDGEKKSECFERDMNLSGFYEHMKPS